ncbi:hypothetical protein FRAHR75_1730003 [Frankia sp. Hr75.2]|nr:hypothetical protein FRAHR75_1730003 [Frankia sp. Hr75.2]
MQVFLSYSTKDRDFARRLASDLERARLEVWLDEHALKVGTDLSAIESAIRSADCLVVVLSTGSIGSEWVERELDLAERSGVRILPVLLEDVPGARGARLSALSHADFRRPQDYRRAVHQLLATIEGHDVRRRFLRAKDAVALVKARYNPQGDLFGISQQGVATLYSLANVWDWEFADVVDGTSRLWITEFFDEATNVIRPYAVVDSEIHKLPEMHLYEKDPEFSEGSVTVFSCAFNHLHPDHRTIEKIDPSHFTKISRRYSYFRPVVLEQNFVDSTVAVRAALESAFNAPTGSIGGSDDLFVLARLECDKHNGELPTWIIAFFDPTLAESVRCVGVDASTGVVRDPGMRSDILNADFFSVQVDEKSGDYVLSLAQQIRAMEGRVWDIPTQGDTRPAKLTFQEAMRMAVELLGGSGEGSRWQVAFLSNTGVVRTALSPAMSSAGTGLMARGGRAGQWVIEVCGTQPTAVTEPDRHGFAYEFKQIVCTRSEGAVEIPDQGHLVLTAALTRSPLPRDLVAAHERARKLAVRQVTTSFYRMSVALSRTPPAAAWHFRFYDTENIISRVTVSIDGRRLLKSSGSPHAEN